MKLFYSVKDFCRNNESFKEGGIRHLIFNEDQNGFKGCFPKVGRKRLVDVEKFFKRIEQTNPDIRK